MKTKQHNYWILMLVFSLVLTACGGGGETETPVPLVVQQNPTEDIPAMQTMAVSTFSAGLTQTASAAPSNTPTATFTSTPTLTPTSTLKRPTYIYLTPTNTLDPLACYPDGEPVCTEIDLTPIGGDCTYVCVDSCGNTTTSSCGGGG